MFNFSIPRLPFRDDRLFGILVLLFLAVPLVFTLGVYEKYETVKFFLFLLLIGAGLIVWSIRPEMARIKSAGLFWALFLLVLFLGFLSTIFSPDRISGILGSYPRFSNGFLFLLAWLVLLLLLLPLVKENKRRLFFFHLVFFDATIIAIVGIAQSLGFGFYEGLNMPVFARAPSLLGNPNFSVMFMAAALPLAAPLFFDAKKFASKIYYVLGVFAIIWATIILSSRGGWLGLFISLFAASILVILCRFSKKQILAFAFLLLFSVSLWWIFFQLTPRENLVTDTLQLNETNVNLRLFVWDISRQAILDKPFLGFGLGNFILAFEKFRGSNLADQAGVFDDPHNIFLHQAVTGGVPFVLAFIGLVALAAWVGFKRIKQTKDLFTVAVFSGLVSLLAMACFNPFSIPNYLLLAFFLSILIVNEPASQEINENSKRFAKVLRIGAGVLGALIIVVSILFFSSELLFYSGAREYNKGQIQKSLNLLKLSMKANPYQEFSRIYIAAGSIRLGLNEKIIEERISQAINLHPHRASAFAISSNLYYLWFYQTGQTVHLDSAILNIKQSIAKDPYFMRRYGRLGYYYLLKGQTQQALAYIKTELSFEPQYLPAWLLLAKVYQFEGEKEQAILALKKASNLSPENKELKILINMAEKATEIKQVLIPGGIFPDIME